MSGACLGRHLGHVWGIIWDMFGGECVQLEPNGEHGDDRQGDSLTSHLQLFKQIDDFPEFLPYFLSIDLNLKKWQELKYSCEKKRI